MPSEWIPIPIESRWFANVHETVLTRAQAAIENGYQNEAGGHSRFPGLEVFCTLPNDNGRVYLHDWRGDLMASTSMGNLFRVNQSGTAENVTGVPISGGHRHIFAKSTDELIIAAGGKPIRFAGKTTEILSEDAPDTTHVGFIDNYVVAIEPYSGRFYHSEAGLYRQWSPLDVFSADGKPDNLNSLIVTDFRELILGGADSLEQFERLPSGDTPFFRRWSVGDGLYAPYCQLFADNGVWLVTKTREMARFSGQTSQPRSDDIAQILEGIDDWTDAWIGGYPNSPLHIRGQKFILLQIPNAINPHGTKGLTLLYDYKQQRWYSLYDWDAVNSIQSRWPGWSYWPLWNSYYVGGEGVIYRLSDTQFNNRGVPQRMLGRTAHLSELGEIRIDNLRARIRRGFGSNVSESVIRIRAIRDNERPTPWATKGLGRAGDKEMYIEFGGFGCATTWQFEWLVTDDCPVELVRLEAQVSPLR